MYHSRVEEMSFMARLASILAVAFLLGSLLGCESPRQKISLGDTDGMEITAPGGQAPEEAPIDVEEVRARAEAGDAEAQIELGDLYSVGRSVEQDHDQALEWYRAAAAQGAVEAEFSIGLAYAQGQGVEQDLDEAIEWYRKAAAGGSARAQLNLGALYDLGQGVEQDYATALEWYRKAADAGLGMAHYNIGVLYANGNGVPQDCEEAVVWFTRAAWAGYAGAGNGIDHCFAGMTEEQKARAKKRAAVEANPNRQAEAAAEGEAAESPVR
jgi:TPR repeat protein